MFFFFLLKTTEMLISLRGCRWGLWGQTARLLRGFGLEWTITTKSRIHPSAWFRRWYKLLWQYATFEIIWNIFWNARKKIIYWVLDVWLYYQHVVLHLFSARSERYHHMASDEDEETNDEESSLEIRQFSSWSHRFSKVMKPKQARWRDGKKSTLQSIILASPTIKLDRSMCVTLFFPGVQQHRTFGYAIQFELLIWSQSQRGQRGPRRCWRA